MRGQNTFQCNAYILYMYEYRYPCYIKFLYHVLSLLDRRGKLQPVQMTVVQRTGNKKVTLVDNLDLYGIPAEEVAHTLQRIAAASTTGMDKQYNWLVHVR